MNKPHDSIERLEKSIKDIDKVAIVIDGYNTIASAKTINMRIDWDKVSRWFRDICRVTCVNFYISTPTSIDPKSDSSDWKPLADWLSHNGYKVTIRKGFYFNYVDNEDTGGYNKNSYKTGYDSDLIADTLAIADKVDRVVLFTSNPDLCPLIETLQNKGIPVTLISNSLGKVKKLKEEGIISSTGNIGIQLIRCANEFYDLDDLKEEIQAEKE